MDAVRVDINLTQTEWDACARELQAASERVHTQCRVAALSTELADLDRALEEHDRWLDATSAGEKRDEAEFRSLSGECQVGVTHSR